MNSLTNTLVLALFVYAIPIAAIAQQQGDTYNKELADSLGADSYGMKSYYFVILKTGPTPMNDKAAVDSTFRGHLANIRRLAESGKLVVAGPLGKNDKSYRGIFIFNTGTLEETRDLLQSDPAIKAGFLATEIYPWYGSAALPTYMEVHKKIAKENP